MSAPSESGFGDSSLTTLFAASGQQCLSALGVDLVEGRTQQVTQRAGAFRVEADSAEWTHVCQGELLRLVLRTV